MKIGDRVRLLRGQQSGRVGAVFKVTPPGRVFDDYVRVLLDPRPRERTRKVVFVAIVDIEEVQP